MSLLRSYLEANAILTAADLEVAVRHQQSQGGSLDTALLELGLLTAAELDLYLGKACGLPTVPARLLETGPVRPWTLVPKALVDIGWAMPLAIEDGNVLVAVHPDLPDARLGQLYRQIRGFMPMVAPECCLAKLAAERSGGIVAPRHAMLVLDVLDALQARDAPQTPQDTLTGIAVPPVYGRPPAPASYTQPTATAPAAWIAPAAPRDLYVDSGATAVLPVGDAADSISATVIGPVPPPDAADSLSATIVGRVPDAGDSLGATTIRRGLASDDPSSSGTFPVAGSGTFSAADSGTFPAASSGIFPDLRSVGAQAPRGARPATAAPAARTPVAKDSRGSTTTPPKSTTASPVPQDSRGSSTTQNKSATASPVPQDSRAADSATPSRSAQPGSPVPQDSRAAAAPSPAEAAPASSERTAPLRSAAMTGTSDTSTAAGTTTTSGTPTAISRSVTLPYDSPYFPVPADPTAHGPGASIAADPGPAEQLAERMAPARVALAQARERDRITAAIVQGAIQIAPRVALFGVKREGLRALAAPGSALQLSTSVVIPIPEGSQLDRAVLGQVRLKLLSEPSLAAAVGRPLGIPCVFEPVYAQDRCVLMLYLDRDGGLFDPPDHAAARDLCDLARSSLEALLRLMGAAASRSSGVVLESSLTRVRSGPAPDASSHTADAATPHQPVLTDSQPVDAATAREHAPTDSKPLTRAPSAAHKTAAHDSEPVTASPARDSKPVAAATTPVSRDSVPLAADVPTQPVSRDSAPLAATPTQPASRDSAPLAAATPTSDLTTGPTGNTPEPLTDAESAASAPLPPKNRDNEPTRPLPVAGRTLEHGNHPVAEILRSRPLRKRQVIALVNPIRRDNTPEVPTNAPRSGSAEADEQPSADAWLANRPSEPEPDDTASEPVSEDSSTDDPAITDEAAPVPEDSHEPAAASPVPEDSHEPAAAHDDPTAHEASPVPEDSHEPTAAHDDPTAHEASPVPEDSHESTSQDPDEPALEPGSELDSAAQDPAPADDRRVEPTDDAAPSERPDTDDGTASARAVLHLPNLVAPPGARRIVGKKGERVRTADLVMPDLRRPGATDATAPATTLSIPASLIAPTPLPGARRRGSKTGHNPVVPGADEITLNMPRLVRDESGAPAEDHATGLTAGFTDLSVPTGDTADSTRTVTDAEATGAPEIADAGPGEQTTSVIEPAPTDLQPATVTDGEAAGLSSGTDESAPAESMTTLTVDDGAAVRSAGIREPDATTSVAPTDAHESPTAATAEPATDLSDRSTSPPAASTEAAAKDPPAEPAPAVDPDKAIEDYLHAPTAPDAIARLRAAGPAVLARIAARFPGPIDLGAQGDARSFPPPSAHGPLLRACIELGATITPHILDLVDHPRPQIRFYAAFLFQELRDPRSMRQLAAHAFDPDPDVRLIATRVLESYSRTSGFVPATEVVRTELRARDRDRVLLAAEAAGTLRDTLAVPVLIDLLSVRDKQVRETALESLCSITAKHHGYRPAKWKAWYTEHGQQTRLEWVIDALRHRDTAVRRWAADELIRITGHRITPPDDGEKPSAKYVLAQWQQWFDAHGGEFPG